ncbi:MAG: hypothetical protein MRQ09_03555 [Candidatus Midichloria sp.]|nr:hypothetical protein [Candidatus Midichloria sp.]
MTIKHRIFVGASNFKKMITASDVFVGKVYGIPGKHPVIFVDFKDVVGDSLQKIEKELRLTINNLYTHYKYIANYLQGKSMDPHRHCLVIIGSNKRV